MDIIHEIAELRGRVRAWRASGERIALVPTMGNLHAGHVRLAERAREIAPRVVVSIFVNPMQFGLGEDFGSYPRTLEADAAKLAAVGVGAVFAPAVAELYPRGLTGMTQVSVPGITEPLCGASRPGHFTGVATVVTKLFNLVQPDVALFGEKDWQQLLVIRRFVEDLDLPVEVIGVPTVREADGLAMSSRNGYLTVEERMLAPMLHGLLESAAERLEQGERDYAALERAALETLTDAGFVPDYFRILRANDLAEPGSDERTLRLFVAARLGRARLIDNLGVELGG